MCAVGEKILLIETNATCLAKTRKLFDEPAEAKDSDKMHVIKLWHLARIRHRGLPSHLGKVNTQIEFGGGLTEAVLVQLWAKMSKPGR